jgi:hypothetical protein
MTTIYCLAASQPLTKTYQRKNGELIKSPYPMTWEFTSHKETVNTLREFELMLNDHASCGHCVLKGLIARDLIQESRAGSTNSNDTTEWLVLDLDGLPEHINVSTGNQMMATPMTISLFMNELGLGDISYIVQWSASFGISDQKIRAHVFIMLDKPYAAPLIKQWLIQKNHEVPFLADALTLTKTGNTLSWPLDISACQNDKLIYISPPVLKGIKDPLAKQPRIQLVKNKHERLSFTGMTINTAEKNKALTHARITKLREASGMPVRKFNYKVVNGQEVLLKPDEAVITEMKVDRGFVYFNLNGGDSWAYYHPEDRPDYIYNFKGEPTYLTKELLPDYWQQLTASGNVRTSSTGISYLAFCDRKTGVYWRGTYDANTDILDITPAKNETQLRHFAKQYGVPLGDFVPEWDLTFNPNDNVRVDVQNRVVNKFSPSIYMKNQAKKTTKCPPTIFRVMHHALGEDVDITEHFINWIAYILQERDRTRTAWVLHGTQGTGKGILTNNILRPIFGAAHTAARRMEELGEKYNHFMSESLMVFVDEVQIKALGNERGVMAKLKNFITEEYVPIRAMHANAVEQRNYTNWLFMSNMPDPVSIDKNDRRFNVGKYQPKRLVVTEQELAQIEKELQSFHDYLMNYVVDLNAVGQVMHSEDRETMISISESSIDTAASALLEGRFAFFIDQLPTTDSYTRNALMLNRVEEYIKALKDFMLRTQPDGKCNISRDELRTVLHYVTGNMPDSPNKFTSLLKHHRIHTKAVWVNKKTVNGLTVTWVDQAQFAAYAKMHFTKEKV